MSRILDHRFVSPKLDGADATQVQPSAWNDGHRFVGGLAGDLLTRDPTDASFGAKWVTPTPEAGWIAYTPIWMVNGVVTSPGTHTIDGAYFRRANAVWFRIKVTIGGGALPTGYWQLGLPVNTSGGQVYLGGGLIFATAGSLAYPVFLNAGPEISNVYPQVIAAGGSLTFVTHNTPGALVAGNYLECRGNYQAAP